MAGIQGGGEGAAAGDDAAHAQRCEEGAAPAQPAAQVRGQEQCRPASESAPFPPE